MRVWIRSRTMVNLDSGQKLQFNPDGSVDLYFGPRAPAGGEDNLGADELQPTPVGTYRNFPDANYETVTRAREHALAI